MQQSPDHGTAAQSVGLLDRLKALGTVWRDIARFASRDEPAALDPAVSADDVQALRRQMQACLDGKGGEVSARARAAALGRAYCGLNRSGRERFLKLLAAEFGPDRARVDAAVQRLAAADDAARIPAETELRQALEAPRARLLTQFTALPEGVKFLVDMRAELLDLAATDPALAALEADLRALLAAWFDVGFLEMHRVTWRSPAVLLEKIMAYEAVHAIQGWDDLKNRLDSDRRLYGFLHPRMPDEPLIFVEVALVKGMAGNIQELLDEAAPVGDPQAADTAIFYSISSAQKGLAGISFGNFLIKRVVDALSAEFKNLKAFATLSPLPGFRAWLDHSLAQGDAVLLTAAERKALAGLDSGHEPPSLRDALAVADWPADDELAAALRAPLLRLAARYLTHEKKNGARALDPVAHFHLTNGARVERLNWLADTSPKGIRQSAGVMVNYLYKLADIEANHEAYTGLGRVAASAAVKATLKG